MYLVGLTGGIATGKSSVSAVFRERGIKVVDADVIAREVVQPGMPAYQRLRAEFGDVIFDDEKGGILIREKLAELVFSDDQVRRKVNAITHPAIRKRIILEIVKNFILGERYIILDTPLLFEVGYDKIVQKIVVVNCSEDEQVRRLMLRDRCDEVAARARINVQMPLSEKLQRATHIIDNSGDRDVTRAQVSALVDEFNASRMPLLIRACFIVVVAIVVYGFKKLISLLFHGVIF
uniref:Dephospho-CoA kinase n=1 Tax=Parascaris univalens TaxID=6257 RepID=A0A915BKL7_PARUN